MQQARASTNPKARAPDLSWAGYQTYTGALLACRQFLEREKSGIWYTLWNRTMVDEIISKNYTFLKAMFDGYTRWIRRVDVARYVVMHQHGGWYADMDYKCIQR